ncbi:hypothetical protein OEZ86_002441 [Tetradesmus obliquus]|nr:hypothetical protein OEZ86_002441 [Tetradesmus obliquus]
MATATAPVAPAPASTLLTVAGLPPPDLALPVLASVNNREQYRKRDENETEEAQWYSPDEPDTMVEPQQVRLKSLHSKAASVIVFTNNSTFPVRALWLDFEGHEVVYSVLEPNSTKRYHTYVTHPWIVREVQSGTRMMLSGRPAVVGLSTEQTVEIQAPKQLPWSLENHCCFSEQYKSEVKALLLCQKKLETAASCTFSKPSPARTSAVPPLPPAVPASPYSASTPFSSCSMDVCCGTPMSPSQSLRCTTPLSSRASFSSANSSGSFAPRSSSPLGMLSAPDVAAPSTATSISISSDATQFTATLTVTSPKRAVLSSRVNMNIEVTTGGFGNTTNINFNTVLDGSDTGIASASTISGCVSPVARKSDKKGIFNMFKNILHPKQHCKVQDQAPATTTFKLQVQTQDTQMLDQGAACMAAPVEDTCWPPMGTHLGHLPSHLMVYIAELAQPVCWQTLQAQPKGRPDILPTLMACSPNLPEEQPEQEQQGGDDQAPPALI